MHGLMMASDCFVVERHVTALLSESTLGMATERSLHLLDLLPQPLT